MPFCTANAEIVLEPKLATYRKWPVGSTHRAAGLAPVKMEKSVTVKAPVVSLMAKMPTVLEVLLATYRNAPLGSTASATGAVPVDANGEPGTRVRNPLAESIENAEIVPAA